MQAVQQSITPLQMHALNKAAYVVADIETANPAEEILNQMIDSAELPEIPDREKLITQRQNEWQAPSTWKDEQKIEAKRQTDFEKIAEAVDAEIDAIIDKRSSIEANTRNKAALSDFAPIICIGVKTDQITLVFNGMDMEAYAIDGIDQVVSCGTERDILGAFRAWLDASTTEVTMLANHNLFGFDLPKLRNAYVRHRLYLPKILQPFTDQPMHDTMRMIGSYSRGHNGQKFVSLDKTCIALGVERPKQVISGAEVPGLFEFGSYEEIITYSAIDAIATAQCFELMTGIANDLG